MRNTLAATGKVVVLAAGLAVSLVNMGCHAPLTRSEVCACPIPRELTKVSLPTYTVEPPDILLVDAIRVVPLPPYKIQPLDLLIIQAKEVLPDAPISGLYPVDPEGTVNLGVYYGSVRLVGQSLDEAKKTIERFLHEQGIKEGFRVVVALAQSRAMQQIRGPHLIRPDGTISLGNYGSVHVTGMTLEEVKKALEAQLSHYLLNPEVSVDVLAYNSKVFYVFLDGAGNGQQVMKLPCTGNETVLDAISMVGGLTPVSSQHRIWVARPGPACCKNDQILPVDWVALSTRGRTETNYQLLPGDRLYVAATPPDIINTALAKVFGPFERIFGISLLGNETVRNIGLPWGQTSTNGVGGI